MGTAAGAESCVRDDGWRVAGAAVSVVKLVMGAGVFSLPYWFMRAGPLGGSLAVAIMGVAAVYTLSMVVEVSRVLSGEDDECIRQIDPEQRSLIETSESPAGSDYGRMAELATGIHWIAPAARIATVASCIGSCAGYIAFVAELISESAFFSWHRETVAFTLGPLLWLLIFARDRNMLGVLCSLGNVAFLLAAAAVLCHGALKGPSGEIWTNVNLPAVPGVLGNAAFLFTIHFCLPSITEAQLKTANERKWFVQRGIPLAILFSVVSAIFFAVLCVLTYGDLILDNVVRNVPRGLLGRLAVVCLSLDLIFTYPLVLLPVENLLARHGPGALNLFWARIALVGCTVLIATRIPNFAFLTAWVGCLSDTPQAFVLPPLMYFYCCIGSNWKRHFSTTVTCFAIGICGLTLMVVGSLDLLIAQTH